jgi:membrane protein
MKWLSPYQVVQCLGRAMTDTINHDGIEHAGYLAFLGLLAMFPFLVFMVAVIGVLGQGEAGSIFITSLLHALPTHITNALEPRVVEIVSGPPQGLLTVSILGAIWTASSAVEGMRTVLNRAYRVETPPAYWFRRSLSILQLLIFTFITIIGMLLMVTLQLMLHNLTFILNIHIDESSRSYLSKMLYIGSVGVLFVAASSLYYSIPNIKQHLISVVPGAVLAVMGWLGAAYALTIYLSHFDQVNLIYGSLGGIIAALIFFYLCNIFLIFGAEFNYQIVHALGLRIIQREEVENPVSSI